MRTLVLVLVLDVACSGSDEQPIDAMPDGPPDPCAKPPPPSERGCGVLGGLGNLELDGLWTFTGTREGFGSMTEPYTASFAIKRTGTGWCQISAGFSSGPLLDPSGNADTYVNDTFAISSSHSAAAQSDSIWSLCVSPTDGMLTYSQDTYHLMGGGTPYHLAYDGVLTR